MPNYRFSKNTQAMALFINALICQNNINPKTNLCLNVKKSLFQQLDEVNNVAHWMFETGFIKKKKKKKSRRPKVLLCIMF